MNNRVKELFAASKSYINNTSAQQRKKVFLLGGLLLLVLTLPLLTVQQLNAPFEKLAYRFNRPPSINEIPKEASGASVLSATTGKVEYPHDYTIVLLGDSMTERLGNSDELRGYLSEFYPDKTFEVLNYGYGATNILTVKERLLNDTDHFRDYQPITKIDFDLIVIESFANNPLSEFSTEEGLKKQSQALDEIIKLIKTNNPTAQIAFLATIAPNKETYAQSSRELTQDVRDEWVQERIAYYENHINYAKTHNIPLINIYKDSQDFFGNGKSIFIDDQDFIHPSPLGVIFISQKLAEGIHDLKLLKE